MRGFDFRSRNIVLVCALLLASSLSWSYPLAGLQPVGSATLKWSFWTIYESTLYDPDGVFSGINHGLALNIEYRRSISRRQLIDATREQWKAMSLYQDDLSDAWLDALSGFWPDVRRGDAITLLVTDGLVSEFYLNGEAIGRISEPGFTENFLAIWLSDESRFPELRDRLIGNSS